MFVHFDVSSGSIWASKFVEILIGSVVDQIDGNMLKILEELNGSSGMGIAFESVGHKKLTNSKSEYPLFALNKPYQRQNKTVNSSMHFNHPIRLIRNIEDIGMLNENEYGLPMIGNFPLIDAVIQPNKLINFTVSNRLLTDWRTVNYNARIVIVTKHSNLDTFQYMSDLSAIRQYVTTYEPID